MSSKSSLYPDELTWKKLQQLRQITIRDHKSWGAYLHILDPSDQTPVGLYTGSSTAKVHGAWTRAKQHECNMNSPVFSEAPSQAPSQPRSDVEHDELTFLIEGRQLGGAIHRTPQAASRTLAFFDAAAISSSFCLNGSTTRRLGDQRVRRGTGATCKVYQTYLVTTLPDGRRTTEVIAIKQKRDISLESWLTSVCKDFRIMSHRSLRNSNVVHTLGYLWEEVKEDGKTFLWPSILMPFAQDGRSLQQWFDSDSFSAFSETDALMVKLAFSRDLADGLPFTNAP
jgi:hypothetical protein